VNTELKLADKNDMSVIENYKRFFYAIEKSSLCFKLNRSQFVRDKNVIIKKRIQENEERKRENNFVGD